jgi:hypothetical protein
MILGLFIWIFAEKQLRNASIKQLARAVSR